MDGEIETPDQESLYLVNPDKEKQELDAALSHYRKAKKAHEEQKKNGNCSSCEERKGEKDSREES